MDRRSPERAPVNHEQNPNSSKIISVEEVLEVIGQSSLLSIQKESLKNSILRFSEEISEEQRIGFQEDLEIALGIPSNKTEGLSLEEREKLLLPRIENLQEELEGALGIKPKEVEYLDLEERRKLVLSRIEELVESNQDNEEKIEELEASLEEATDPNLVVRAVVEGWLGIPITKLEGSDRIKLEQELGRLIPGFTLIEV